MITGQRLRRTVAVLALVLTTAAGCRLTDGGGTDGGADGTKTGAGNAAPASAAPASAPTASTGTDDAAFCTLAKQIGPANLDVFDGQSTNAEQARQAVANLERLAAAAPEEIHADFARFVRLERALLDAGDAPGTDLEQEAGSTEIRESLQRIGAYLSQHCGIGS